MAIQKYSLGSRVISDISDAYDPFKYLIDARVRETSGSRWVNRKTGEISFDCTVAFFGKSGYGKSTTVNAFVGEGVMEVSDVDACTRRCNCVDYEISKGSYISIADFPGLGENLYKNAEYMKMYKDFMESVGVVVYVLRADARDYSVDEQVYEQVLSSYEARKKVIFALNQCDKVEPISRRSGIKPTEEQMINIDKKINFLRDKFEPENKIIPYSASTGWNVDELASEIVDVGISLDLFDDVSLDGIFWSSSRRLKKVQDEGERLLERINYFRNSFDGL